MGKYSSVLFGADRYEKVGPFRFPIWNELVPGEVRNFERLAKKQSQATFRSIKLAQKIASMRGISTQDAIELLSNINSEENQDLLYEFAEDLGGIQDANLSEHETKMEYVTAFMQFRGEVKMPGSKEYTQTRDWDIEDTNTMPTEYLNAIHDIIVKERDGWDVEGKAQAKTEETA